MNFWVTVKKLNERGKKRKKMLNAKLECYLARPHALPYEISALYIYIYIYIDDYSFITPNH